MFLAVPCLAQNKNNAFGVRLGEPLGFTFKRYMANHTRAFELLMGTAAKTWDRAYYINSFEKEDDYDGYVYIDHDVNSVLFLQGRALFHTDINAPELEGKLQWYWGIGGVLKTAKLEYEYRTPEAPYEFFKDSRTDFDFGPEGIAGLEYTFKNAPVMLFIELSMMVEIVNRPELHVLGGTGARFIF